MECDNIHILETRWTNLLTSIGVIKSADIAHWFNVIATHYSENHRFYHTLAHIQDLLSLLDEYAPKLSDRVACEFSIWFHDVIYQPTKKNNEEESALLFTRFAKEFMLSFQVDSFVGRVVKYIRASANHTSVNSEGDRDMEFFLDFDLSILGRAAETYGLYSSQIRQEYIHYNDEEYRKGRIEVLKKMLQAADSLFRTEELGTRFLSQSKENLTREIAILEDRSTSFPILSHQHKHS